MGFNPIIYRLDDPAGLEQLHADNPTAFAQNLAAAIETNPASETLRVWQARINFAGTRSTALTMPAAKNSLRLLALLSLCAYLTEKLPSFLPIDQQWFYERFGVAVGIIALICWFCIRGGVFSRMTVVVFGLMAIVLTLIGLLPDRDYSDSILMATLHAPLLLISLLGVAFTGRQWRENAARSRYIGYLGEVAMLSGLILIGGIVLVLLALGLFALLAYNAEGFLFEHIVIWGLVSAPLVATYLYDITLNRDSKLASMIANVFAPLFLVLTLGYLIIMVAEQRSPFADREFLIAINGLLIIVWAIAVYSIAGRTRCNHSRWVSGVNVALLATTLIIDAIALLAILFRLGEYGMSPNKLCIVGANLLIAIHLIWILISYAHDLRTGRGSERANTAVAAYLPVYTLWSAVVVFILPVSFGYA